MRGDKIVSAALATGAQAIHPGYGFLSERVVLARLAEDNGLTFKRVPVNSTRGFAKAIAAGDGDVLLLGEAGVRSLAIPGARMQ